MESKKNGLIPGWPPFSKFKEEMTELVNFAVKEEVKPLKQDIGTIKDSILGVHNRMTSIEKHLSNHVTDTDKKIDSISIDVGEIKGILSDRNKN